MNGLFGWARAPAPLSIEKTEPAGPEAAASVSTATDTRVNAPISSPEARVSEERSNGPVIWGLIGLVAIVGIVLAVTMARRKQE